MSQSNKFPTWEEGTCDCGARQDEVCELTDPEDLESFEPFYKFTCPGCLLEGCHECMPDGRGCSCPECEEAEIDE